MIKKKEKNLIDAFSPLWDFMKEINNIRGRNVSANISFYFVFIHLHIYVKANFMKIEVKNAKITAVNFILFLFFKFKCHFKRFNLLSLLH